MMLQALTIERAAATRTAERVLHHHIAQYCACQIVRYSSARIALAQRVTCAKTRVVVHCIIAFGDYIWAQFL
jgi:hypothetical protein